MTRSEDPRREPLERKGVVYVVRDHFAVVVHLALLLGSARVWGWYNAFVVAGVMLAIKSTTAIVCLRINPAVLNARGTKHEMSGKEKAFFAVFVPASLALPVVAGFEVGTHGWTHASAAELAAGLVMMVAGGIIGIAALAANAFFEPTVRVQSDRDHQVCTSGPYRFVRHPGYVSAMMVVLSVPLILGSRWAFVPAAVECIALVVRTAHEDALLRTELAGYAEFARSTRYRLFPLLW